MNAGARQTLLLVDADPQSLRVLDVSLKKAGYEVVTAQGGAEALERLAEHAIDLVISDTHMPQMDGFELCRRIKEHAEWARIPFIFLSSRKTIEDKIRGLEIGVEDYLIKPVYIKEITTRVRMLLQRRQRERLESRRDTRTRFAGDLSDIGIVDLLQTIEVNRKSGIVHVHNVDGRRGAIYFRDGRVIDAEAGRLGGVEAVYRLFSWNEGTFEVEFKNIRRRDVIEHSGQTLLMEGMRRLDEWTRLIDSLPPLEAVFEVDYFVLAEKLADIPDEVNAILRLFDGRRSLLKVIEDSDFPDLEAISVIARLHTDRVIYEARGTPPEHGEIRQTRLGRLERWLSESPWANVEEAAPSADEFSADTVSEPGRDTLTGFTTSEDTPTRAVGTTPGMPVVDEGLADLARVPVGRTLPGFAPVRLTPGEGVLTASARPSEQPPDEVETSTEVETREPDPERTPSPSIAVGAQPVDEMKGPEVPGASGDSLAEAETPVAEAAAASPSEPTGSESQEDEEPEAGPRPIPNEDQPLRGTRPDDLTPILLQAVADPDDAKALTAEAEPFPDEPSKPGGTMVLPPEPPPPAEPEPEPPAGTPPRIEAPEPAVRRAGSARHDDGASDDGLLISPGRRRLQGALLFAGAVVVGMAAWWLVTRNRVTAPIPRGAPAVAVARPEEALDPPAPAAPPSEEAPAANALPPVSLPKPEAAEPEAVEETAKEVAKAEAAPSETPAATADPVAKPPPRPELDPATAEAVLAACRKAYDSQRYRAIIDNCRQALELRPNEAPVMVMLAHAELDRGRSSTALRWARKAISVDPELADAYVFIGEIEQGAGNTAGAKSAYTKYLELAPNGKYASDLRTILRNL